MAFYGEGSGSTRTGSSTAGSTSTASSLRWIDAVGISSSNIQEDETVVVDDVQSVRDYITQHNLQLKTQTERFTPHQALHVSKLARSVRGNDEAITNLLHHGHLHLPASLDDCNNITSSFLEAAQSSFEAEKNSLATKTKKKGRNLCHNLFVRDDELQDIVDAYESGVDEESKKWKTQLVLNLLKKKNQNQKNPGKGPQRQHIPLPDARYIKDYQRITGAGDDESNDISSTPTSGGGRGENGDRGSSSSSSSSARSSTAAASTRRQRQQRQQGLSSLKMYSSIFHKNHKPIILAVDYPALLGVVSLCFKNKTSYQYMKRACTNAFVISGTILDLVLDLQHHNNQLNNNSNNENQNQKITSGLATSEGIRTARVSKRNRASHDPGDSSEDDPAGSFPSSSSLSSDLPSKKKQRLQDQENVEVSLLNLKPPPPSATKAAATDNGNDAPSNSNGKEQDSQSHDYKEVFAKLRQLGNDDGSTSMVDTPVDLDCADTRDLVYAISIRFMEYKNAQYPPSHPYHYRKPKLKDVFKEVANELKVDVAALERKVSYSQIYTHVKTRKMRMNKLKTNNNNKITSAVGGERQKRQGGPEEKEELSSRVEQPAANTYTIETISIEELMSPNYGQRGQSTASSFSAAASRAAAAAAAAATSALAGVVGTARKAVGRVATFPSTSTTAAAASSRGDSQQQQTVYTYRERQSLDYKPMYDQLQAKFDHLKEERDGLFRQLVSAELERDEMRSNFEAQKERNAELEERFLQLQQRQGQGQNSETLMEDYGYPSTTKLTPV